MPRVMEEALPYILTHIPVHATATRLQCHRKTVWTLCLAGVLNRVFHGCQTIGITLNSIERYEVCLDYRMMREYGQARAMSRERKDVSPLHYRIVMGRSNPLKRRVRAKRT